MSKISIVLTPRFRLDAAIVKTKSRGPTIAEPLFPPFSKLRRVRRGNVISRFFRHVFEHSKLQRLLGTNLAALLVASSFLPGVTLSSTNPEVNVVYTDKVYIPTEQGIIYPLDTVRITQGYSLFHRGIDFDGIIGDAVHPIIDGRTAEVSYSRFGYGNTVVINHGNGLSTRYAHLSRIRAELGQSVTTSDVIGEVGATGRSFGDHLHLEVLEHGVQINPLLILPPRVK